MFDREIVMDSLRKIRMAIETILERAAVVNDPNELLLPEVLCKAKRQSRTG